MSTTCIFIQALDVISVTLFPRSVGKSFGFESPPHIDLGVGVSRRNRPGKREGGGGKKDQRAKIYRPGKHNPKPGTQFSR